VQKRSQQKRSVQKRSWLTKSRCLANQHQTKIRFVLAGALNTGFGLGAYPALYYLLATQKLHELMLMGVQKVHYLIMLTTIPYYLIVLTVSQIVCVTFAYLTNKFLVFRTKGNYGTEFMKFITFHLSYFLVNLAALPVLVVFFGINPIIAQTSFAVMVIVSSYFWHSRITFSSK